MTVLSSSHPTLPTLYCLQVLHSPNPFLLFPPHLTLPGSLMPRTRQAYSSWVLAASSAYNTSLPYLCGLLPKSFACQFECHLFRKDFLSILRAIPNPPPSNVLSHDPYRYLEILTSLPSVFLTTV